MKDYYLLNKKKIEYKNILNELTNIDTDVYTINDAYIENGNVFISGNLKEGINNDKRFKIMPEKYYPRIITYGTYGCGNSMDDITRIGYVRIDSEGYLDLWINNLSGREGFNIQYPLKV